MKYDFIIINSKERKRNILRQLFGFVCLMATFNNISAISWWRISEIATDLLQVTAKLDHIMLYRVHPSWAGFELTTLVVITVPDFPIGLAGWSLGPQNLRGHLAKMYHIFDIVIDLSYTCCHNPSVIFLAFYFRIILS